MRFEMARALVSRAKDRAAWIGDDHGDPYEEALLAGTVPIDMKIAFKELRDHLRSSLDYAAREVCESCATSKHTGPIYFPIVNRNFRTADFRSRVGKLMPGVLERRPEFLPLLASFQPFSDAENGWLADLATLSNETKHEHLSVSEVSALQVSIEATPSGSMLFKVDNDNGASFDRFPLMLVEGMPLSGTGNGRFLYLSVKPINQELLSFLRKVIPGVERIINELEASVR